MAAAKSCSVCFGGETAEPFVDNAQLSVRHRFSSINTNVIMFNQEIGSSCAALILLGLLLYMESA